MTDLPPLRAAVKLAQQLTKVHDDASRECIVHLLDQVRHRIAISRHDPATLPSTKLGRKILKVLGDGKFNARTIARLCGQSYTGTVRGELARLVKAGLVKKVSGLYVKKCLDTSKNEETPILKVNETA